MCKVFDEALPVLGAVGGTLIGGPVGGAIGAGLGGAVGSYTQNHNFGDAALSGAVSGGTSYLGGALGAGLGAAGATAAPGTLAGATAVGDTAAPELMGLGTTSANGLEGLGGATPGWGGASGALSGAAGGSSDGMGGVTGSPTDASAGTGVTVGSPIDSANTTGLYGSPLSSGAPSANPSAVSSMAQTGSGAPMGYDGGSVGQSIEGSQAAPQPGGLQSMYGNPDGSTTGSGAPQGFGGAGGQATNVAPPPQTLGGLGGSGIQGSDVLNLGKVGMDYLGQMRQQNSQNNYANSIKDIFSPTGAYATQMQQTLARQDAAAGRNSQGGTRAVQLAAALAGKQADALGGAGYRASATATPSMNALNGIFNTFSSPQGMQSANRLGSAAFNGLSNLFN